MLGTFVVREIHVRDVQWWWKGKEETAPFDGPAEEGRLEKYSGFLCSQSLRLATK